jgi:hypothetical protein
LEQLPRLKCEHYDPWTKVSDLIAMDECWHFIYYSGRCDCQVNITYANQDCPWNGRPNDPIHNGSGK